MIERHLLSEVLQGLQEVPAVCLLGPRQAGKTTLALRVAELIGGVYLDLESPRDLAKLSDPEAYLLLHLGELVILDEVHRVPGLFPILRGLIDQARRRGKRAGLYLLLGSASLDLLRQSGESLAGRVRYLELTPFFVLEPTDRPLEALWLRGGFPESLLAETELQSFRWRQDFIRTYLEREIPRFGTRLPAEMLRRLWVMLAHRQGGTLNAAELARNLGIDVRTVNRYLDLLVDLFLVRRLPPWHANVEKRLVRSPRLYIRDSGLLHALLDIIDMETLLSHPVVGASWEGFVIENLIASAPTGTTFYFYRTAGGAEIDLLIVWPDGRRWAVEVKRSLSPRPDRGFYAACEDVRPEKQFIVYPGSDRFPVGQGIEALPLIELARLLQAQKHTA
ncbi:ATP-binding protein [Rhodothermus marinus]|uniref:ATP-binding protein n=1 Tax=Rhodothermus marinus TaxID=29549 RepID=UPI0012BA37F1|nr:ATP-binding protein [Rhodothermus marinus]BBM70093.1 ATPase [Rhodothermus marinus]BBM73079.1 ATPase [Rhodothermus marinus]